MGEIASKSEREEVKLYLSADEMILYIENPKDNNKRVKINTFNKFFRIEDKYIKISWFSIHQTVRKEKLS